MIKTSISKKLKGDKWKAEKQRWRDFCEGESTMPIYFKAWYWDATCEDSDDWWVILLNDDKDEIEAAFPFVYSNRKGLYFIDTPWQVASAGIWIRGDKGTNRIDLSVLKKMADNIIDRLPYYDRFSVTFYGTWWNWQPFYWRGFNAEPTYTMIINMASKSSENNTLLNCKEFDSLKNMKTQSRQCEGEAISDKVKEYVTRDRRKRINRGEKKYQIRVNSITFDVYWDFLKDSYIDRKKNLSYEREKFRKLFEALFVHNAAQLRAVYDEKRLVAINIMLVDDYRIYHQFGTQMKNADPNATSYAVYDAICYAVENEKIFDFEGSMIQGVCEFNSSFNPTWETHYKIEKYSKKYSIVNNLRSIINLLNDKGI